MQVLERRELMAIVGIQSTFNATEGGAAGYFRLTRDTTAGGLTVSYTVNPSPMSSALAGTDYSALAGSVSFASGSATVDIPVTAVDDSLVESTETVNISLTTSAGGYTLGSPSSASVSIVDNDVAPVVSVSTVQNTAEGAAAGYFRLWRTGGTGSALTVPYTVWGPPSSTATAGTDYTSLSGSATFPIGAATVDVLVTPVDDSLVESSETVYLMLSTPFGGGYTLGSPSSGTLSIADNDVAAAVSISSIQNTTEGAAAGYFRLSRTGGTGGTLTVPYTVWGSPSSTATAGTDYTALSGSAVFPIGASTVDIVVSPIDDSLIESNETVYLALNSPMGGGYTLSSPSSGTLSIADNDTIATVQISATQNTAENAVPGYFRLSRSGLTTSALAVNYSVGTSGSNVATPGTDYTALTGTVTFPAGAATVDIPVSPQPDLIDEPAETVQVTITTGSGYVLGTTVTGTVSITSANLPLVQLGTFVNEMQTIVIPAATGGTYTLTYAGQTTAGIAYNAGAATVQTALEGLSNIAPGDVVVSGSGTIASPFVVSFGGTLAGTNVAQVTATGTNLLGAATTAATTTQDGSTGINEVQTITNSGNVTANFTLSFNGSAATTGILTSSSAATVKERLEALSTIGAGNVSVTKEYNGSGYPVWTVTFQGALGSAIQPELVVEFESVHAHVSIATITQGSNSPTNEVQLVSVLDATGGSFTLTFEGQTTSALAYNGGSASIQAALEALSNVGNGDAIVTGPAGGPWSIAYQGGLGGRSVDLLVINKANLSGGTITTATSSEGQGGQDAVVSTGEGIAPGRFRFTRTGSVAQALTVYYTLGAGTATAGTDYTALSGSAVIPTGQSHVDVEVAAIEDSLLESSETVLITLSNPPSGPFTYVRGQTLNATMQVADNDATTTVRVVSVQSATEGISNGYVRILRTGPVGQALTVNYQIASTGTALPGVDYALPTGSIVIPAGSMTADIPVLAFADGISEGDETLVLDLLAGSGYSVGSIPSGTVTIVNSNLPLVRLGTFVNEVQTIVIPVATGGTYTLTYAGQATAGIAYNASAAMVRSALEALSNIAVGDIAVAGMGTAFSPFTITFSGLLAGANVSQITANGANLLGTATNNLTVTRDGATSTSEVQTITASALAVSNYVGWRLVFNGQTTVLLSSSATAEIVQTALANLSNVGSGNVAVTSDVDGSGLPVWTVTFIGALAGVNQTELTVQLSAPYAGSGWYTVATVIDGSTAPIDEIQLLDVTGATGGTFTLTFEGQTTSGIAVNATAATVQLALESLSNVGVADAIVTGSAGGPWTVAFQGGLGGRSVDALVADITNLTGGTIQVATSLQGQGGEDAVVDTGEGLAPGRFRITRTGSVAQALTVYYTVGAGTATAGTDYTALNGTAVIPAGQSYVDIEVAGIEDSLLESSETVLITLNNPPSGPTYLLASATTATLQIADNDDTTTVRVIGTQNAIEGVTNGYVRILRTGPVDQPLTVNYQIAPTGNAVPGLDYEIPTGTIAFAASAMTVDIPIIWIDDSLLESTETLAIELLPSTIPSGAGSYGLGAPVLGALSLLDDDGTTYVHVEWLQDAIEGGQEGIYRVTRSGSLVNSLLVHYFLDTPPGGAMMTLDYAAASQYVSFAAGQSTADIKITAVQDSLVENSEPLRVNLVSLPPGTPGGYPYSIRTPSTAILNIIDDDISTEISISSTQDAQEGLVDGYFRISRIGNIASALTFFYSVDAADSTADAGADYEQLVGTASFPAGQSYVDIPVSSVHDLVDETNETVTIELVSYAGTPGGLLGIDYLIVSPASATVTIIDNDDVAAVSTTDFQLVNDTQTPADLITTDPTLTGQVVGDGQALYEVEFDHNGDDEADGTASTDELLKFTYSPADLPFGQTVIRTRARYWDDAIFNYAFGSWATISFLYHAPVNEIATINEISLTNDTGTSKTDKITTDPRLTVSIANDGPLGGIMVDFDHNGDGTVEKTIVTPAGGTFRYRPNGLPVGANTIRARTREWDRATGVTTVSQWTPFEFTLTPAVNGLIAVQTLALLNDTGDSAVDSITSDTSLTGQLVNDDDVAFHTVQFDHNGDNVVDGSVIASESGRFTYLSVTPSNGSNTIRARGREWDYDLQAYRFGPWSSITFTYVPAVNVAPTVAVLALLSDSGASSTDLVTANPNLVGTIANDGSIGDLLIEIDENNDSTVDGSTYTNHGGEFSYAPVGLQHGPVTVRARAVEWDSRQGVQLVGPWTTLTFTYAAQANLAAVIVGMELLHDTGTSATDGVTADPTLIGSITNEGSVQHVTIEFDHNANGVADGSTTTDEFGNFQYTPIGLLAGPVTIKARTRESGGAGQPVLYSGWGTYSFTFQGDAGAAPTISTFGLITDNGTSGFDTITSLSGVKGVVTNDGAVGGLRIEFDHNGDNVADGSTTSGSAGQFSYLPAGLAAGATATIRARAREWSASGAAVWSPWASTTFTLQPAAPVVSHLNLQSDTGVSATDRRSSDPTLAGQLTGAVIASISVQIDNNNDGAPDATVVTDSSGLFSHLPTGLAQGAVRIQARSAIVGLDGSVIVGPWKSLAFIHSATPDSADAHTDGALAGIDAAQMAHDEAVAAADAAYQTSLDAADGGFHESLNQLDATHSSNLLAAEATYQSAVEAANSSHLAAMTVANLAFVAAMGPFADEVGDFDFGSFKWPDAPAAHQIPQPASGAPAGFPELAPLQYSGESWDAERDSTYISTVRAAEATLQSSKLAAHELYKTEVNAANEQYQDDEQDAKAIRDAAFSDAEDDYQDEMEAVNPTDMAVENTAHQSRVTTARTTLDNALNAAWAARNSAVNSAYQSYQAILATSGNSFADRNNARHTYHSAIATANAAYALIAADCQRNYGISVQDSTETLREKQAEHNGWKKSINSHTAHDRLAARAAAIEVYDKAIADAVRKQSRAIALAEHKRANSEADAERVQAQANANARLSAVNLWTRFSQWTQSPATPWEQYQQALAVHAHDRELTVAAAQSVFDIAEIDEALTEAYARADAQEVHDDAVAAANKSAKIAKSVASRDFYADSVGPDYVQATTISELLRTRAGQLITAEHLYAQTMAGKHSESSIAQSAASRDYSQAVHDAYQQYLSDHNYQAYSNAVQQARTTLRDISAQISRDHQHDAIDASGTLATSRTAADQGYRLGVNEATKIQRDDVADEHEEAELAIAGADTGLYAALGAIKADRDRTFADVHYVYADAVAFDQLTLTAAMSVEDEELGRENATSHQEFSEAVATNRVNELAVLAAASPWATYQHALAVAEKLAVIEREGVEVALANDVAAARLTFAAVQRAAEYDYSIDEALADRAHSRDTADADQLRAANHAAVAFAFAGSVIGADTGKIKALTGADKTLRNTQATQQKTMRDGMGAAARTRSHTVVDLWFQYVTTAIDHASYTTQTQAADDQRNLTQADKERDWSKAIADARYGWTETTADAAVDAAESIAAAKKTASEGLVQADLGWEIELAGLEREYAVALAAASKSYDLLVDPEELIHQRAIAGLSRASTQDLSGADANQLVRSATAEANYQINRWTAHHSNMVALATGNPSSINTYNVAYAAAQQAFVTAEAIAKIAKANQLADANLLYSDNYATAVYDSAYLVPNVDLAYFTATTGADYDRAVGSADANFDREVSEIVAKYDYRVAITHAPADHSVSEATAKRTLLVNTADAWRDYGHKVADAYHSLRVAKFTSAANTSYHQAVQTATTERNDQLEPLNVSYTETTGVSHVGMVTAVANAEYELTVAFALAERVHVEDLLDVSEAYWLAERPANLIHTNTVTLREQAHAGAIASANRMWTDGISAANSQMVGTLVSSKAAREGAVGAAEAAYHLANAIDIAGTTSGMTSDSAEDRFDAARAQLFIDWLAAVTPAYVAYRTAVGTSEGAYNLSLAQYDEVHEFRSAFAEYGLTIANAASDKAHTNDTESARSSFETAAEPRTRAYKLAEADARVVSIEHSADARRDNAIALAQAYNAYRNTVAESYSDHIFAGYWSGSEYSAYQEDVEEATDIRNLAIAEANLDLAVELGDAAVDWTETVTAAGIAYHAIEAPAQAALAVTLALLDKTRSDQRAAAEETRSNNLASAKADRWTAVAVASGSSEIAASNAVNTFFLTQYTETKNLLADAAEQSAQDRNVTGLRLLADTGTTGDFVTYNTTLLGEVDAGGMPGFFQIEFDHNNDGLVDGRAVTNSAGQFSYSPLGLGLGAAMIRARAIQENSSGTPVPGDWSTINLTVAAHPTATASFTQFALQTDTGSSTTDRLSASAAVTGVVASAGTISGLIVDFDVNGDGIVDGTATTNASGQFTFVPSGLAEGFISLRAQVGGSEWTRLDMVYAANPDVALQVAGASQHHASLAEAEYAWASQIVLDAAAHANSLASVRQWYANAVSSAYQSMVNTTGASVTTLTNLTALSSFNLAGFSSAGGQDYTEDLAALERTYKISVAEVEERYQIDLAVAAYDRANGGTTAEYNIDVQAAKDLRKSDLETAARDFAIAEAAEMGELVALITDKQLDQAITLSNGWTLRNANQSAQVEIFNAAEANAQYDRQLLVANATAAFVDLTGATYTSQMSTFATAAGTPWAAHHASLAAAGAESNASKADALRDRLINESMAERDRSTVEAAVAEVKANQTIVAESTQVLAKTAADVQRVLARADARARLTTDGGKTPEFVLPKAGAPPLAKLGYAASLVQNGVSPYSNYGGDPYHGYFNGFGYGYGYYNYFGHAYFGDDLGYGAGGFGYGYGGYSGYGFGSGYGGWFGGYGGFGYPGQGYGYGLGYSGLTGYGGWYGGVGYYGGAYGLGYAGYGMGLGNGWYGTYGGYGGFGYGSGYDAYGLPGGGWNYGLGGWAGGYGDYGLGYTSKTRTIASWGISPSGTPADGHPFTDRALQEFGAALRATVPVSLSKLVQSNYDFVPDLDNVDKTIGLNDERQLTQQSGEVANPRFSPNPIAAILVTSISTVDHSLTPGAESSILLDNQPNGDPIQVFEVAMFAQVIGQEQKVANEEKAAQDGEEEQTVLNFIQTTDLQRIPAERIDGMVRDGLGTVVKKGGLTFVVMPLVMPDANIIVYVLRRDQDNIPNAGRGPAIPQPPRPFFYRTVAFHIVYQLQPGRPESELKAIRDRELSAEKALKTVNDRYFSKIDTQQLQLVAGVVEVGLHVVPVGAAADYALQGNWHEAKLSLVGDAASLLSGGIGTLVTRAGKAVKIAKAARVIGRVTEGSLATYRLQEGWGYANHPEAEMRAKAAAPLGEAFMRFFGMSAEMATSITKAAATKLATKAAVPRNATAQASRALVQHGDNAAAIAGRSRHMDEVISLVPTKTNTGAIGTSYLSSWLRPSKLRTYLPDIQVLRQPEGVDTCLPVTVDMILNELIPGRKILDPAKAGFTIRAPVGDLGGGLMPGAVVGYVNAAAEQVNAKMLRGSLDEAIESGSSFIAVLGNSRRGHAVVVDGVSEVFGKKYFIIRDPANGAYMEPVEWLDGYLNLDETYISTPCFWFAKKS